MYSCVLIYVGILKEHDCFISRNECISYLNTIVLAFYFNSIRIIIVKHHRTFFWWGTIQEIYYYEYFVQLLQEWQKTAQIY